MYIYIYMHTEIEGFNSFPVTGCWDHLGWRFFTSPPRSDIIFSRMKKLASSWNRSWTDKKNTQNIWRCMEVLMDEQHNGLGSVSIKIGAHHKSYISCDSSESRQCNISSYHILAYPINTTIDLFGCEDRGILVDPWQMNCPDR